MSRLHCGFRRALQFHAVALGVLNIDGWTVPLRAIAPLNALMDNALAVQVGQHSVAVEVFQGQAEMVHIVAIFWECVCLFFPASAPCFRM